jgi:hypothetical protein
VAKNAYISEKWSKSLQNIKVGDVVERTIYVKAMGTLPSFIPDFSFKKLDFASVYPKEATFKDLKTDTDVNGSKVQTITYLFEKEGLFTIPNLSITWWNPYAQKIFSKSTSSIEVRVKANPNLNMLSTARDSLNINQSLIQVERTEPWYKSFTLKQWISLALITLLTYFILRLTISLTKRIIQHRKDYKYSDSYYFNLIRKARNNKEIINALYQWLYKTGNVYSTREMNSDSELQASFEELQESIFLNKKSTYKKYSFIKKISRIKKGGKINTNKFRLNP